MLYCDLILNGAVAWTGVPCLLGVPLDSRPYMRFKGRLLFVDMSGVSDPTYDLLGTRYLLVYVPADGSDNQVVPLQANASQQLYVVLGGQNCVLSVYERTFYTI